MTGPVRRRTVDLSAYPDLVVIYLGMRVNAMTGLKTLFGFGPKIANAVAAAPEGLLVHETMLYSLFPPHFGMFSARARAGAPAGQCGGPAAGR
jgi:hypothetical protein